MEEIASDDNRLMRYLRVLGVKNRLALLRALQVPKAVNEIRLVASRRSRTATPDRPISRQALARHLAALSGLGLVVSRAGERNGRPVTEYLVSHARLFVLSDELGRLATIRPVPRETPLTAGRSTIGSKRSHATVPSGPALVVANGPASGHAHPLEGPGPWLVGRERGLAVSMAHDPFVSKENARVRRDGDRFFLEALAARNGTRLNFQELQPGDVRPLASGDAIGVGRSLLFVRGL